MWDLQERDYGIWLQIRLEEKWLKILVIDFREENQKQENEIKILIVVFQCLVKFLERE